MARSNQPARPMWRGVALLAPWVAGCAGLQTQVPDASQPVEGVAYFMPRKDFVLTVHLKDSTITSLA